jgi:putative membrane protein
MTASELPTLNAILNGCSLVLLVVGFTYIKRGNRAAHKRLMLSALISSALFLTSYLIYHAEAGSTPYPHHDWTRPAYFAVLIPHVTLAAVMVPFILAAVYYAWKNNFVKHTRITRWLWPVWVFVSLSGIIVYLMLYQL